MMDSSAGTGVMRHISGAMKSKTFSDAIFKAQGIDPSVISQISPVDDEVAPVPPAWAAGAGVTPGVSTIKLSLVAAPTIDYVKDMKIELNRGGTITYLTTAYDPNYVIRDLMIEEYVVRVQYIDNWGRESSWSTTRTTTPHDVASLGIDLTKAGILGRLNGLLPNANLATIEDAAKLGEGVVTADAMATMDLAAMQAWVGTAAIDNAMIANLSADKITAGNIDVTVNITAGGTISAGGVTMNENGFRMGEASGGLDSYPSDALADWLTGPTNANAPVPYAGIAPFNDVATGVGTYRGWIVSADGAASGDKRGAIYMRATDGNQGTAGISRGGIRINSGKNGTRGYVSIIGGLVGGTMIAPEFESGWLSITAGSIRTYVPGFTIGHLYVRFSTSSDGSSPQLVPNPAMSIAVEDVGGNNVQVRNNTTGTRWIQVQAWRYGWHLI